MWASPKLLAALIRAEKLLSRCDVLDEPGGTLDAVREAIAEAIGGPKP
jgi:hypothetical protein